MPAGDAVSTVGDAANGVLGGAGQSVGDVASGVVGGAGQSVGGVVGGAGQSVGDVASGVVGGAGQSVGGVVGGAGESVGDVAAGVVGAPPLSGVVSPGGLTLPGEGARPGALPVAHGPSAAGAVEVSPASHGAPGGGPVAIGDLAGGAASPAAGGVMPGSGPLAAVPGHPGLNGIGSGDPGAAFPGAAPGPGVSASTLDPAAGMPAFDPATGGSASGPGALMPHPAAVAPAPGSSPLDPVTQFAGDHRTLVTAALAGLVGAAVVGPRAGNVAAAADIAFTNVRLIPCVVKDGAARGGAAIGDAVANGRARAAAAGGGVAHGVSGAARRAQEVTRDEIQAVVRSLKQGFDSAIDARPPVGEEEGGNSFLVAVGVALGVAYLAALSVCFWLLRTRAGARTP